jgi:Na+/H+ antiporter NhaA
MCIALQISVAKGLVMGHGMMLGKVIGLIGSSWLPVDNELELFDSVADSVEAHVHGSGFALLYSIVGYALSTFIVCLDGGSSKVTRMLQAS